LNPTTATTDVVAELAAGPSTTMLAAPTLTGVSALIFTVLGTIIMAFVAVRMFIAYTKKNWGELITELAAVIFVGWFVWFPDSATTTIKALIQGIFG
jgi:hypothetical protein